MAAERNKRFYIWDLKELNGFTHTSMVIEPFNMWPSGNCGHVYSATSQQAKRHISGWAMRNTNNHNINILKKSCLGVLVCNRSCQRADSTPVAVRPAICDKARRKQIGRKCPNGCGGVLMLQQCKGHNGYPVTHFWRHYEDKVFFIGKGFHDHPKPEVKLTSEKRRAYTKNPNRITKTRTRHSYVPPSAPATSSALSGLRTAETTMLYPTQGTNNATAMNYYAALCNQNAANPTQSSQLANQHLQQQQQQLLLERHIQNQLQVQQTLKLQQLHNSYSSYPSCQYQQQDLRRKYYEAAASTSTDRATSHLDNSLNLWSPPGEGRHLPSYVESTSDSRYRFLRQNTIGSGSNASALSSSSLTSTSYPSLDYTMKSSYYPYQTTQPAPTVLGEDAAGTILDLSLVPNATSTWRSDEIYASTSSTSLLSGCSKYSSLTTSTTTTTSSETTRESSTLYVPKVATASSGSLELPKFLSFPALIDGLDHPEDVDTGVFSSSSKDLPKAPSKCLESSMPTTSSHSTIQELIDIENMDMDDISNIVNLSASANRPPPTLISDQPITTISNSSSLPALSSFLRGIEYL